VTVTDFREIKMQNLQFGADVEVISPETLRQEIATEIDRMGCLYQKNRTADAGSRKKFPRWDLGCLRWRVMLDHEKISYPPRGG
jgi:hypothetical protein